jgi:glycosyltransferase involved in cell wall biosynthesis
MNGLIIDARFLMSSGIGVYLRTLLPNIFERFQNEKIIIYCKSQDKNWFLQWASTNLEIRILDAPAYSIQEQFFWLAQTFRHKNFVFWSPQYNIPLTHRGPLVVTVHDMAHLVLPEYKNSWMKSLYAKTMFHFIGKWANKILCVSEFTKKQMVQTTRIDPKKIEVIHLGLEESRLQVPQTPIKLKMPPSFVLFVGNIKNHKNLRNLVLSMKQVQSQRVLPLVIVGKKDGFITPGENIFRLADTQGISYLFSGEVSDAELVSIYRQASILVFPSFYEGFGLPPLEAMYLGCPVAASSAASIPEVCGDAAFYFDPNSIPEISTVINEIISDDALRKNLISRGYERFKKFSVQSFQNKTIAALNSLVKDTGDVQDLR